MSRRYWGCEMESNLYWEVVNEMKEKKEARGQQRIETIRVKRGKRSIN